MGDCECMHNFASVVVCLPTGNFASVDGIDTSLPEYFGDDNRVGSFSDANL